jgi:uncharacterized membrane protein YcfT
MSFHHHDYFYANRESYIHYYDDEYEDFLMDNFNSIIRLRRKVNILYDFKYLFYSLKYKNQFRYILWEKIRRPKIETKYHPSNLYKMMEDLTEEDDLTELLEKW